MTLVSQSDVRSRTDVRFRWLLINVYCNNLWNENVRSSILIQAFSRIQTQRPFTKCYGLQVNLNCTYISIEGKQIKEKIFVHWHVYVENLFDRDHESWVTFQHGSL